jgi:uncharacterized membrane protein YuzA (DUF378 family)
MERMLEMITGVLVLVGALNWGLVGAFDFNLVTALLGDGTFTKAVYILVGLSALYGMFMMVKAKYE